MNTPQLRTSVSTGPREDRNSDGYVFTLSRPCPECNGQISDGEEITYTPAGWGHVDCIERLLVEVRSTDAWLLLGSQLARRPSYFNAAEIRVIAANLLRAAAGMPTEGWKPGARPIDDAEED